MIDETKFKDYRKKPVVIQAYQTETEEFIETLEGTMKANVGDYIIKGVQGELYPCKPDIFDETYENVKAPVSIEDYYNEWERSIDEITIKETRRMVLKETYQQLEQKIIDETDFKALYGKNNETVRKNHVRAELKEELDELNDLKLRIDYLKRRIDFIKSLMRINSALISDNGIK